MRLRRLSAVVRGPRLVAAGLALLLAYLFATNLTPRPEYVVRTEAKLDQGPTFRGPAFWGTARHVCDDGRRVIVGIHRGDFRGYNSRLEEWDASTGTNLTPAHWNDPDWQRLLIDGCNCEWRVTGLMELVSDPSGREFLRDEAAWAALRERLANGRARHVEDIRQRVRPVKERETCGSPFPDSIRFSRDGRFVTYVTLRGWPVHVVSESMGDGIAVEDTRTGQPVGAVTYIAPDGRTAVSWEAPDEPEGEEPGLILWDVETGMPRAKLLFPDAPRRVVYSRDGRYVFAASGRWFESDMLRWWDTATGRQVGEIGGPGVHFVDGGRVLAVQANDDQVLHFWGGPTGRELGDWEPGKPPGTTGRLGGLLTRDGGRYLAAEFAPDPNPTPDYPFVDRILKHLPVGGSAREEGRVVVLDVAERRVLGPVPGERAALSPNGRWLATLDADGVVRVWPVPFGRPWLRGLAYAAATVFGGWGAWRLIGRCRRRKSLSDLGTAQATRAA